MTSTPTSADAAAVPLPRLAVPVDELPFKNDRALYGVHALPVTWEPDSIRPRATTEQD